MRRREFIGAAALLPLAAVRQASAQERPRVINTISYNVLGCRGYPETPQNRERLLADRGQLSERTAKALKEFAPDWVTFQEGPQVDKIRRIADAMEMRFAFFPGGWEGDDEYPGGFPGAVVSCWPIVESESRPSATGPHDVELFTRHLGRAKLDTPIGTLHVVSAHLHPSDLAVRAAEVTAVIALVRALNSDAEVVLQGDFNHMPDGPEYPRWKEAGLVDVLAKLGSDGATFPSTGPKRRIDYIWATPKLAEAARIGRVLSDPPFAPADEASYGLSDHVPVFASFAV